MSTATRVLIADDHQIIRQGLRSLLKSQPGVEVVAEAEDGRTAVRLAQELSPDVVVMDINMPDLNGIDATRQIIGAGDQPPKVIALSAYANRRFILEMLAAGATAFVAKDSAFADLAQAMAAVASDKVYLSPSVSNLTLTALAEGELPPSVFNELSPREREILQLTAEGKAMKEIAAELDISVKTVETHRRKVMDKLQIDNVAQLTKYAVREGLTAL